MSLDENIARQADEVEALSAIYGDEWKAVDVASRSYCIHIADKTENPKLEANLLVRLSEAYPLHGPPDYEINATWLRDASRARLENKLWEICCENPGEDLIYLLAEAIRDFLQNFSDEGSFETCVAEDEFDLTVLGDFTKLSFKETLSEASAVDCPEIIHGETLTDRKSTFQPHLAVVVNKTQISAVMSKLCENKKIANATHNMLAYRIIPAEGGPAYQGCDDDGETHAGSRMLHLLQVMNAENVLVVVSRWYGGIHLGPDRFKHINNCTRQILEANGFSRDKEKKIVPKKGKKTR
ncbi:protein impact-like [Plakobranchus ocellatus]|uniref:Protein impact-like n=1 Tax=Plakobranchus ocellatus TaxID=259542 RepID=A0AAV4D390_9GAST|nr:protein impact-like [Plakobranchus ocellatus]